MPHTEASDPETSWKSAAKETAPWSQWGVCCLPRLGAHCDGMEDFFPAPQAQAASVDAEFGHKWAQGAELLKTLKYFYSYK